MTKQTQQLILMLIIGVFIGIMAVKVFSSNRAEAPVTSTTPTAANTTLDGGLPTQEKVLSSAKEFPLPPAVPENSRVGITVANQTAGKTVLVSDLGVNETSWVAVYEAKDGKPGSILGAQRVSAGDKSALVELLRPEGTRSGSKYFAALLPDNGDGVFDRLTDLPPFSPEKVVIVSFLAE